jgi:hypothetical protein
MSGSQTFQRITRQTIDEHRQIHFYLDQVALTLKSIGGGTTEEALRRLAAQIEGLKERLLEHHHAEEKGGLFQAILEAMPDCRVEVSRLTLQHDKMIEILEMARIHAQCGSAAEAAALRADLESFLEMFRRHEQDEEQLLKLALTREGRSLAD